MNRLSDCQPHKVFPKTYLYRVLFSVSFDTFDFSCYTEFSETLRKEIGIEISKERFEDVERRVSSYR